MVQAKNRENEGSDLVMAVGWSVWNTNGVDIEQRTENDAGSRAKWIIIKPEQRYAMVNNYYDEGYPVRFGETAGASEGLINGYMDEVAKRYLDLLGLVIIRNYTIGELKGWVMVLIIQRMRARMLLGQSRSIISTKQIRGTPKKTHIATGMGKNLRRRLKWHWKWAGKERIW